LLRPLGASDGFCGTGSAVMGLGANTGTVMVLVRKVMTVFIWLTLGYAYYSIRGCTKGYSSLIVAAFQAGLRGLCDQLCLLG
jgi:hypothetical protein